MRSFLYRLSYHYYAQTNYRYDTKGSLIALFGDRQAAMYARLKVLTSLLPKSLYPQVVKLLDYALRPHLDDCDDVPYCPRHRDAVGNCGEVDYGDDGGGDDTEDMDTDNPIPNRMKSSIPNNYSTTNSSHICKDYSNSSTDRSSHSTNHTKGLELRPTSQTSRLYTLAQPKPYRPKP